MERLNKIAQVAAVVLEVVFFVAQGLLLLAFLASFIYPDGMGAFVGDISDARFERVELNGFGINVAANGQILWGQMRIALICGFITSGLMAMVFRNVSLIFKTTRGKTWFSQGETPFQKDNVRMVREIGIFCISVPVVAEAFNILAAACFGADVTDGAVSINGIILGVLVLCLSQYFAYGMQLQRETDGLV